MNTKTPKEVFAETSVPPVLMSIKSKWLEMIVSGAKTAEVRKSSPRKYWDEFSGELSFNPTVLFYETSPVCAVAYAARITSCDFVPTRRYDVKCESETRVTKEEFAKYAGNLYGAYLWRISDVFMLDKPLTLAEIGIRRAPQSWVYMRKWWSIDSNDEGMKK